MHQKQQRPAIKSRHCLLAAGHRLADAAACFMVQVGLHDLKSPVPGVKYVALQRFVDTMGPLLPFAEVRQRGGLEE